MNPWIGVDLDGTLAHYDGWVAPDSIGAPIPSMVKRVKRWLADGNIVKIFTARVSDPDQALVAEPAIKAWCRTHIGQELEVTCRKDFGMTVLFDDRCVRVVTNTGIIHLVDEHAE